MRVATELPLPESIADHYGFGEAWYRIARPEYASQRGLSAENLEIIETAAEHLNAFRMVASAQRRARREDDADVIENTGAVANVFELRFGHGDIFGARAIQIVKHPHQALRILERKRPQKHRVHHCEDGDVRADA